jgi:hypothetical protein
MSREKPHEGIRSGDSSFSPYFGNDDLAAILQRYWRDMSSKGTQVLNS